MFQYKKDLQAIFDALPVTERNALLGVKGHSDPPSRAQTLVSASSNEVLSVVDNAPGNQLSERATNSGGDENQMTPHKLGRSRAAVDPGKAIEKAAKVSSSRSANIMADYILGPFQEKERFEKKAAKAEKERKDKESQEKARSMMASFFGKAKSSSTTTSPSKGPIPSTSSALSEFDRVFRPFTLKKDVELAPINWIQDAKRRKRIADVKVIVIDEDDAGDHDVEMDEPGPTPNASTRGNILFCIRMIVVIKLMTLEYIHHVLSQCPSLPIGSCSPDTIRSLMMRLSEAEVSGDTAAVRALLSHLQDRTRIPARVFIFHKDERPGYFGTFTKCSRLVKPRRPFARDDIALDYTYDSGEEWGEEDEGGGDDVLGDSDDERDDENESDDLDGWLVDGDEEEVATPIEEREGLDAFPFPPIPESSKSKRKAGKEKETDTDGKAKKRKVVVPLVPFVKGPCWETEIGRCEYEPFNQYRIQFFNGKFLSFHPRSLTKLPVQDTPYPIDPFDFVLVPMDARNAPGPSTASTSASKHQSQFVMPALPPHILNSSTPSSEAASPDSVNGQQQSQSKRSRTIPKNPFPEDHLPFLKEKVASMGTTSLIALVEALHLDLKVHRVKKNAIEAKIREICIKDQRHIWSLKADTEVCVSHIVKDCG